MTKNIFLSILKKLDVHDEHLKITCYSLIKENLKKNMSVSCVFS